MSVPNGVGGICYKGHSESLLSKGTLQYKDAISYSDEYPSSHLRMNGEGVA